MSNRLIEIGGGVRERAVLVVSQLSSVAGWDLKDLTAELSDLTQAAGVEVLDSVTSSRHKRDAAYLLGKGKIYEVKGVVDAAEANVVIFNEDLSPAQQRNVEEQIDEKVIDRTQLILDIFARRAFAREGKLQVELAQLSYLLPRLAGKGIILSRLGGGIGTRGPGETKLEVDRRRIRKRIGRLKKELEGVESRRVLQRESKRRAEFLTVAIVGYTNSGKSTLLNATTGSRVLTEDKPFATLDPVMRKSALADGRGLLFVDTIGFIRGLPHHLIAAFHATLGDLISADLLLHVLDVSHPNVERQHTSVVETLSQLNIERKERITVLNKIDLIENHSVVRRAMRKYPNSVAISALEKIGMDDLLERVASSLPNVRERVRLKFPQSDGRLAALLHERGRVVSEEYVGNDVIVDVELDKRFLGAVERYKEE